MERQAVDKLALEYFSNYFGDNLNEDTSDEDIMEAVYDLIDLTEAVLEAISGEEYLNEISPEMAARAFGARSYRTYLNPSEHGAKQSGKNFEHMRRRADAAGAQPDDMTKHFEKGAEGEKKKSPLFRIQQTAGDKKGGRALKLLKRIRKHTNLPPTIDQVRPWTRELGEMKTFTQYLNEISLSLARKAEGMRAVRTISNPSDKGIEQTAKNQFYGDQKNQRLKRSGLVDAGDLALVNDVNRNLGAATELKNLLTKSPYRAKQAKRSMSDPRASRDFNRRVQLKKMSMLRRRIAPRQHTIPKWHWDYSDL